jgi:hypothetical protein
MKLYAYAWAGLAVEDQPSRSGSILRRRRDRASAETLSGVDPYPAVGHRGGYLRRTSF